MFDKSNNRGGKWQDFKHNVIASHELFLPCRGRAAANDRPAAENFKAWNSPQRVLTGVFARVRDFTSYVKWEYFHEEPIPL